MKAFKNLLVGMSVVALTACGSGGGNTSTGGVYMSHEEIARDFVYRMNIDAGESVELVKINTQQYNYIVVYDRYYNTYDAYDLTWYNPGENVRAYLANHDSWFYYDLDYIGNGLYQDYYTGKIFQKTEAKGKDLQKVAALKQGVQVKQSAKFMQAEFGMTEARSLQVAKLAVQVADAPKGSMTDKDYDNFAKEILGSSITEFNAAAKKAAQGNKASLDELIGQAAQLNGLTSEGVDKILASLVK